MLPQELKAMVVDKEVFLFEGLAHPVMCDKIKYYQDPAFKQRLVPKVEFSYIFLSKEGWIVSIASAIY